MSDVAWNPGRLFEPDHGTLEGIRVHQDRAEPLCWDCEDRLAKVVAEGLPTSFDTRRNGRGPSSSRFRQSPDGEGSTR